MSGGSKDSWIISFPKDPAALTRFLCTSSTNKCLIEPQTACTPDSAALTGAEVETMSIVGGTSACSAGSGAASVDGTSLSYGLKVSLQAVTGVSSCACAHRLSACESEVCMSALYCGYYSLVQVVALLTSQVPPLHVCSQRSPHMNPHCEALYDWLLCLG